eukprot:c10725_g1_i1.p1 GENE.c10725_g1_i1~~c10725_g1_i1.p1  ORF type:complete len:496 (+),score=79.19 c10725_g1_i1:23-1510(+)
MGSQFSLTAPSEVECGDLVSFAHTNTAPPFGSLHVTISASEAADQNIVLPCDASGEISLTAPTTPCVLHANLISDQGVPITQKSVIVCARQNPTSARTPLQVVQRGVTLSVNSLKPVGCPQTIQFARQGGCQSGDYIELKAPGSKAVWDWCRNHTSGTMSLNSGSQTGQATLTYFENGGIIQQGSEIARLQFSLSNPVRSFRIRPDTRWLVAGSQAGFPLEVEFTPNGAALLSDVECSVVMRAHPGGIRIWSSPFTLAQSRIEVPTPRAGGQFEVAFVVSTNAGSPTTLASAWVTVQPPETSSRIWFAQGGRDLKVLARRQGAMVEIAVEGPLVNLEDSVLVLRVNRSRNPLEAPALTDLQVPEQRVHVSESGIVRLMPLAEGLYHVCLGLKHSSAHLLADWSLLVVTSLATHESATVPVAIESVPRSDPLPDSASPQSSALCVACMDRQISIKLEPCCHACLCGECADRLQEAGHRRCPICRNPVVGTQRIFLP